jgi:flavodoxin
MKTLIAWFSWSGNTEKIARNLAAKTEADLFRIETVKPYSRDYHTCAYVEAKNEVDNRIHPPIRTPLPDITAYDNIIVAFPIWWYTMPMAVLTFLESYDWKGKKVWLFADSYTDDPTYMDNALRDARQAAPSAEFARGLFNGELKHADSWLSEHLI